MSKLDNLLRHLPEHMNKETTSNNYKFLSCFAPAFEEITVQIENLNKSIHISTAVETELDDIGELFQLPRKTDENDTNYRARIKAFWPGLTGGGTEEAIEAAIARLTDVSEDDVTITEYDVACKIKLTVSIPEFTINPQTVVDVANRAKAAGVYIVFQISTDLTETYNNWIDNVDITSSPYIFPDWYYLDSDALPL